MYKAGSTVLVNNKNNSFFSISRWIRFFTGEYKGVELTHSMFTMGQDFNSRENQVFSAEKTMSIMPLRHFRRNANIDYMIFEWKDIPEEFLSELAYHLYDKYAVEDYAYFQLLGHIYRWFVEKVFRRKNMVEKKNPFPNGNVCSELWGRLGEIVTENFNPILDVIIKKWNLNSVNPLDIYKLIDQNPEYFTLVERRGFKEMREWN